MTNFDVDLTKPGLKVKNNFEKFEGLLRESQKINK